MPTEKQFKAYCKVQQSGKYNMLIDCNDAADEAGLDLDTYHCIIANYSDLKKRYDKPKCTNFTAFHPISDK